MTGQLDLLARDKARLAALSDYMILDTPPEHNFDDIVQLAAQLCHTPMSLVTLIDADRQWFKAKIGIDGEESPLDRSVCKLGLDRTDLLIIPDLATDPRTEDNPVVSDDPPIRFYAGAPLIAPRGEVMGMLCVVDHEPRPEGLTPEQQMMLTTLGRQVISQMELRRAMVRRIEEDVERRQLNDLLTERLNQTLAMIHGLAGQTLRSLSSQGPVESFQKRLDALTEANEMLQRKRWVNADMTSVVRASVERHGSADRFSLSGPGVPLGPKGAVTTAMLLHELGSNAVKYGALSNAMGHVTVEWTVDGEGDGAVLTLRWTERGGPPAVAPAQKSFGGKLIAMGLGGGGAIREDFGETGYAASFQAPVAHLQVE
jgi:two-component sensor histidine kinase